MSTLEQAARELEKKTARLMHVGCEAGAPSSKDWGDEWRALVADVRELQHALRAALSAQPAAEEARPVAWLCELAQEDGSVKTQIVQEDPDGLRWNDSGEPSPFRVTPLYAAPPARPVAPAGWKCVPVTPTPEHLRSMAIRYDHGLGLDGYYDQPGFGYAGVTHAKRLDATIRTMRQLYEEAIGEGFYRLAASPAAPAPVALSEEQIGALSWHLEAEKQFEEYTGRPFWVVTGKHDFARAAIAEFCRINGITAPSAAEGGHNGQAERT